MSSTTTSPYPFAAMTGASSLIGFELAKRGYELFITAEDAESDAAADALRADGATVDTERAALTRPDEVEKLVARIGETRRPVHAAILNAGVVTGGTFAEDTNLEGHLKEIDLNIRSSVHLAYRRLPALKQAGQGRLLITSSIAATAPGPFLSVYSASKAFLKSFAEALREELRDGGVTVTALMPGPTDNEFFERVGLLDTKLGAGQKNDPAEVARQGYEALMAGDDHVVTGAFKNATQVAAGNVLPDPAGAQQHRKMTEPGSARAGTVPREREQLGPQRSRRGGLTASRRAPVGAGTYADDEVMSHGPRRVCGVELAPTPPGASVAE